MRISDWSSDVCSSDLGCSGLRAPIKPWAVMPGTGKRRTISTMWCVRRNTDRSPSRSSCCNWRRSEEHTSELQSLMRISYAVFCLKKKKINKNKQQISQHTDNNTTVSIKYKQQQSY